MENSENIQLLEKVLTAIGQSGSMVIGEYQSWFVVSAICWILISFVGIFALTKWKVSDDCFDSNPMAGQILKWVCIFLFFCIICSFMPDLFSPKAAAIHQLLSDIL